MPHPDAGRGGCIIEPADSSPLDRLLTCFREISPSTLSRSSAEGEGERDLWGAQPWSWCGEGEPRALWAGA